MLQTHETEKQSGTRNNCWRPLFKCRILEPEHIDLNWSRNVFCSPLASSGPICSRNFTHSVTCSPSCNTCSTNRAARNLSNHFSCELTISRPRSCADVLVKHELERARCPTVAHFASSICLLNGQCCRSRSTKHVICVHVSSFVHKPFSGVGPSDISKRGLFQGQLVIKFREGDAPVVVSTHLIVEVFSSLSHEILLRFCLCVC